MRVAITPAARTEAEIRKVDINAVVPTGIGGYIQLSDVKLANGRDQVPHVKITALAREIAKQNQIALREISVSGSGRVTKKDVLKAVRAKSEVREIPHSQMRRVIANRMASSMREVPQYTIFSELDADMLVENLRAYKEALAQSGAEKPTLTDLLVYLTARVIRKNPLLNSTFCEDRVVIHPQINIGIAVALADGLIVPNIKCADEKSLLQITNERDTFVKKARGNRLLPDDYSNGTFTITNLGQFPVQFSTPIINQPESAILGFGTLTQKPVVRDGHIETGWTIGVSMTCDHRHIDGVTAANFFSDLQMSLNQRIKSEQMFNVAL
jgi:pyruvate dehydrogenase E2 component (dihydrolipoamide acetyltransferase)